MAACTSSEDTRMKMINAAGELAAEVGIDNVSTRAVADFSGENIGSIHYHFGGKKGLWVAVVKQAMSGCVKIGKMEDLDELERDPTPQKFSAMIRKVVFNEITDLFRSGRPDWYSPVIYQLLRRDDDLYDLFREGRLDPHMDFLCRLFHMINPELDEEEMFICGSLMVMPIFDHANYRQVMQRRLGVESYSDGYLKKLEDLLVLQAQRLLGLPEDV